MNIYNMLLFESFNEIHEICKKYNIKNYTINSDGTIDVDGSVYLSESHLKKLPLKFRNVTGYFDCSYNELTTLEGAPESVDGFFNCYNNKLTTLEHAPQSVGGDFYCSENILTTLNGAPRSIDGAFYCMHNKLITLIGAPQSVNDWFNCQNNHLITLEGAPKSVGGDFICSRNPLESIRKLFPDDNTFLEAYNEWKFFAGGNKIYKHRFLEAMLDIGKKLPKSIRGYEYI